MNRPRVSIVIPFFDCAYVSEAIQSALDQTYPEVEVVVVSDGATRHLEELGPHLDRVRLVVKENGGTASALNAGIRASTGDLFSWLSSDDVFLPRKTERQVELMAATGARVSHGAFFLIDADSRATAGPLGEGALGPREIVRGFRAGCPVNGCTVVADMEVLFEAGLFDEGTGLVQDYDLWFRLARRHDFAYLDEPLLLYRQHAAQATIRLRETLDAQAEATRRRHRRTLAQIAWRGARERLPSLR